jgi:hypothetical protein
MFKSKRTASSPPPALERDLELNDTPTPKRAKTSKQHLTDVAPLAERMRPKTLDELVGQEHLVGKGSLLRALMESGTTGSMILVGCVFLNLIFVYYLSPWFLTRRKVGPAW